MQVQIAEQWRNHSALGCSLARSIPLIRLASAARFDYGAFQPHPYELQHTPVHHPHPHARQEVIVRNRIEVTFEVRVIHRLIPSLQMPAYLLQRLVSRAPRSEAIGAVLEIGFKDRLQDQQGRHLDHPVAHRRYAQRPQFPIRLGNVDAPYRFRHIGLGAQRCLYFIQESLDAGFRCFDLLDLHTIHPRGALVGAHPLPCRLQHIVPTDPVVQRMEPELRLLLGLLTQLLSQQREFLRQGPLSPRFRRDLGPSRLSRSGRFLQAALLSSHSSSASSKAPSLHARYALLRYCGPLRLPARAAPSVIDSLGPWGSVALPRPAGSPRFLGCSVPARCPLPPRKARRVLSLVASPPMAGFTTLWRAGHLRLASRGRIGFASATARRFASPVSTSPITRSGSGSATCMNEQFTW